MRAVSEATSIALVRDSADGATEEVRSEEGSLLEQALRTINLSVFRRHPGGASALGSACKSGRSAV
jgi:hypothetical protein